ncbi:MAG: thioredoxin family protein [Candidatus Hodarchaeota archaeon]
MDQIDKVFFETGISFKEYLERMESEEDRKRTQRYYDRVLRDFSSSQLKVSIKRKLHLVVIVATWCWDCKTNIPVIARIVENSLNITLKLFIKEEIMDTGLLAKINASERIPQLLVFSEDFWFIDRWVERSIRAYQLYAEYKNRYGWGKDRFDLFLKEYRKAYLRQKKEIDQAVIKEIHGILVKADALSEATARYH